MEQGQNPCEEAENRCVTGHADLHEPTVDGWWLPESSYGGVDVHLRRKATSRRAFRWLLEHF